MGELDALADLETDIALLHWDYLLSDEGSNVAAFPRRALRVHPWRLLPLGPY
jgi:hypothetical protein